MTTAPTDVTGLIELKLRDIHDLVHELDPSPFHEKDLNQSAEEFIVEWAMEHPTGVPLEIRVHVDAPAQGEAAAHVEATIRNHFARKRDSSARRLRQTINRGWLSLLIGLAFLSICLGGADLARRRGEAPIYQIAQYSFIIAGWVAMSRPLEIFLYEWWPIGRERRVYDRLSRAKVQIVPKS